MPAQEFSTIWCLSFLVLSSGNLDLGSRLVVVKHHDDAATQIRVERTAPDSAVMCYRSGSGSGNEAANVHPFPGICAHILVNGTTATNGADFVVGSTSSQGLAILSLSANISIVCYNPHWDRVMGAKCTGIHSSGSVMNRLGDVVIDSGYEVPYSVDGQLEYPNLRMARLADDAAVVCYQKETNETWADKTICTYVKVSHSSIVKGPDVVLGTTWRPSDWSRKTGGKPLEGVALSGFSPDIAVACYNQKRWSPWYHSSLVCNTLSISPTGGFLKGEDVVVMVDENSYLATEIRVAAYSSQYGVVCYRLLRFEGQSYPAICARLQLPCRLYNNVHGCSFHNNSGLSKGFDVTIASVSPLGLSLEIFSAKLALACYAPLKGASDSNQLDGRVGLVCNTLTLVCYSSSSGALTTSCDSESVWLLKGPDMIVDNTEVTQIRISSSSPTTGTLCYRREDASSVPFYPGVCSYVQLGTSQTYQRFSPGRVLGSVAHDGIASAALSLTSSFACYNPSSSSNMGLTCDILSTSSAPDLQTTTTKTTTATDKHVSSNASTSTGRGGTGTSSVQVLRRSGTSTKAEMSPTTTAATTTPSVSWQAWGRPIMGQLSQAVRSTAYITVLLALYNSLCMF